MEIRWFFLLASIFVIKRKFVLTNDKIKWENIFFDVEKEDNTFIFGRLKYKLNENKSFFFKNGNFTVKQLNEICYSLNYDDFHSFSITYYEKNWIEVFEFDLINFGY